LTVFPGRSTIGIEEFAGIFDNDFVSLSRILSLYYNRYSYTVKPTTSTGFLILMSKGFSTIFGFIGGFQPEVERGFGKLSFAPHHSFEIGETLAALLSRTDYTSEEAVHNALASIPSWLQTLFSRLIQEFSYLANGIRKWRGEATARHPLWISYRVRSRFSARGFW
jgi:hypothetical protein